MTSKRHQQAFQVQLQAHRRIVYKVAAMYARSREDRLDLEQEICTQLWRSYGRFDPARAAFSTWMYRIALNVAISQVRREAGRHAAAHEPLDEHHLETLPGSPGVHEPDPRLQALYVLIDGLGPLNRALILLYLEDRSYREIADVLGLSETNVATKIGRIKQKLRGQATVAQAIGA